MTAPTWIDQTLRLTEDPELDYNPATAEFEIVWKVPEISESRLTLLVPREVVDRLSSKARELLAIITVIVPTIAAWAL